jgi:hypothetical protein
MMNKDGDQGVVARSKRPIEKLSDTNSSLFTHLNMSSQAYDSNGLRSSEGQVTPRYELSGSQ